MAPSESPHQTTSSLYDESSLSHHLYALFTNSRHVTMSLMSFLGHLAVTNIGFVTLSDRLFFYLS